MVKFWPKELTFFFFFCQLNVLRKAKFTWTVNVLSNLLQTITFIQLVMYFYFTSLTVADI